MQYFVKGGEIVVPGRKVLHKYDEPVAVDMYIRQVRGNRVPLLYPAFGTWGLLMFGGFWMLRG